MARRKRKTTRRRRYTRKKAAPRKKDKATPLGATLGTMYGGAQALFVPAAGTTGSLASAAKDLNFSLILTRLPLVAKEPDVYKPILGGLLISAAPNLPLIGMLARPVNKAVRKVSKGKASL